MTFGTIDTAELEIKVVTGIIKAPDESEFVFDLRKKVYFNVMIDLHGKFP